MQRWLNKAIIAGVRVLDALIKAHSDVDRDTIIYDYEHAVTKKYIDADNIRFFRQELNITSIYTTIGGVLGTPAAYALDKLNFYG